MVLNNTYERQLKYHQHRMRVQNAKSIVNSQAPQRKMNENPERRNYSYVEMLTLLNDYAQKKISVARTFTKSPDTILKRSRSNPSQQQQQRHHYVYQLQKPHHSQQVLRQLQSATKVRLSPPLPQPQQHQQQQQQHQCCGCGCCDLVESRHDMNQQQLQTFIEKNRQCDISECVLKRYEHLIMPPNIALLRKLLRPKIYFDMEVKNVRPLGRIVIQLYTEACPEVVLEFVRVCTTQQKDRFNFTRLFPPLWFEGELTLSDYKTLTIPNLEHDMNVLDHGSSAGILSFPSRYVRGSKRRFLSFSISFKPLKVLNGKRIAFGKVRRGHWILDAIQDYGTRTGKPLKEIVVIKCGMLK